MASRHIDEIVGRNVRARRHDLGISTDEITRRCGDSGVLMTRDVLQAIERAERPCRVHELCALAAALEWSPRLFMMPDQQHERAVAWGDDPEAPAMTASEFGALWVLWVLIPEQDSPLPIGLRAQITHDPDVFGALLRDAMGGNFAETVALTTCALLSYSLTGPTGLHVVGEDMRVRSSNDAASQLHGFNHFDLHGMPITALFADWEEGQHVIDNVLPALPRGIPQMIDPIRMRSRDGSIFWQQTMIAAIESGTEPTYVFTFWELDRTL